MASAKKDSKIDPRRSVNIIFSICFFYDEVLLAPSATTTPGRQSEPKEAFDKCGAQVNSNKPGEREVNLPKNARGLPCRRKAIENGAVGLLTKPIDFGQLRLEIDNRLGQTA